MEEKEPKLYIDAGETSFDTRAFFGDKDISSFISRITVDIAPSSLNTVKIEGYLGLLNLEGIPPGQIFLQLDCSGNGLYFSQLTHEERETIMSILQTAYSRVRAQGNGTGQ